MNGASASAASSGSAPNSLPTTPSRSSGSSTLSSAPAPRTSTPSLQVGGDIPGGVHTLLGATKQLQDTLRDWSERKASVGQVSDVYIQVVNKFNTVVNAFAYHQIDLTDVLSVPTDLRRVLEPCLAEDQSPETLAHYMPELKRVLIALLKGLDSRKENWRTRALVDPSSAASRTASPRLSR